MAFDYFLLIKTAQAEFRAWSELDSDAKSLITPIVEITRGLKRPKAGKSDEDLRAKPGVYYFDRGLERVREHFGGSEPVVLDLTREDGLSCYEIDQLSISDDGYKNWCAFLGEQEKYFERLIPTLLVNPSAGETAEEYVANLSAQCKLMMERYTGIAYRCSVLIDPDFIYDLELLAEAINKYIADGNSFILILDHEFIRPGMGMLHALTTSGAIDAVRALVPQAMFVVLSTSFPRSVEELGDPENDSFPMEEVYLFEEVRNLQGANVDLRYGDYGSINPVRSDQSGSNGWRPRIDFPTSNQRIYYYREKREEDLSEKSGKKPYADHYVSVAKNVTADPRFNDVKNSWGVKQIYAAAEGSPPGKSPSFWISVRMEIFIRQQLTRLGLLAP